MVRVDGGSYQMVSNYGEDEELPVHTETVGAFYIGKTEVTQALWEAVMGSNPSFQKGVNLPVEKVAWDDCQTFINRLNQLTGRTFRLPSEAEWGYAARGGNKSKGFTYSGSNTIGSVAWYEDNSGDKTHQVAQKQANELGLYDMSGNVWEWCSDIYIDSSFPTGNSSYRVNCGGGWGDSADDCCVTARGLYPPGYLGSDVGLRLAL